MTTSQEFNESRDDPALDHPLDGRVLLLGQQLSELGGSVQLGVGGFREDGLHHLGEVGELLQNQPKKAG